MNRLALITFALLSTTTQACDRDQDLSATDLVARAIEAKGGRPALDKCRGYSMSFVGKFFRGDQSAEARAHVEGEQGVWQKMVDQTPSATTVIVTDGDAWEAAQDGARDLPEALESRMREAMYSDWVTSLLPLTKPQFKLSKLGRSKHDGREFLGLSVVQAGRPTVELYFDASTFLIHRTVITWTLSALKHESTYEDYKKVDGIMAPSRIVGFENKERVSEITVVNNKCVAAPTAAPTRPAPVADPTPPAPSTPATKP